MSILMDENPSYPDPGSPMWPALAAQADAFFAMNPGAERVHLSASFEWNTPGDYDGSFYPSVAAFTNDYTLTVGPFTYARGEA